MTESYEASDDNKAIVSVSFFREMYELHFSKNIFTGDESWLLFKNVYWKKDCISKVQTLKGHATVVHSKKAM